MGEHSSRAEDAVVVVLDEDVEREPAIMAALESAGRCRVMRPEELTPSSGTIVALLAADPPGAVELTQSLMRIPGAARAQLIVALPVARAREADAFVIAGASVVALPLRLNEVQPVLAAAIEAGGVPQRSVIAAPRRPVSGPGQMWGDSVAMRDVFSAIERVARGSATVLVLGETGTGKEMAARAIHACSPRASGPFVAINLSALPKDLVEDELFGHAAGAFTGSKGARAGRIEAAQGGTLFLDEIGDLPMPVQVKLLRLLQERIYERVGENQARQADFRLVCATHRDLETLIEDGGFREDLYYRINVVQVVMPPLRERGDDLALLAAAFLARYAEAAGVRVSLSSAALDAIQRYHWPGNVRELQHTIERAVAMALDGDVIGPELVKPRKRRGPLAEITSDILANDRGLDAALSEIERAVLEASLSRCHGNTSRAAQMLKLPRQTLQHRMKKHGLVSPNG